MPTIVVEVMPKPELLDPAGKAVAGALAKQGHQVTGVRIGKRIELSVAELTPTTLDEVRRIAEDWLANGVIEDVVSVREA